jgi:hypothetical protein
MDCRLQKELEGISEQLKKNIQSSEKEEPPTFLD